MTSGRKGFDPTSNPARGKACKSCPWRRDSAQGWLGPYTVEEWLSMAHGDGAIACHETISKDECWGGARQCRGASQYRANICKSPRAGGVVTGPADRVSIFGRPQEFMIHHKGADNDDG